MDVVTDDLVAFLRKLLQEGRQRATKSTLGRLWQARIRLNGGGFHGKRETDPRHTLHKARSQRVNPRKDVIMNSPALGLRVASVVFGLMGLGQLMRIIVCTGLQVGGCYISRWWSAVAVIVLAALCVWLWMLASKAAKPKVETPPAKPAA